MNENLNKILGELEEDLKKLQSAREQVETVITHYKETAKRVDEIVESTKSLGKETTDIIKDISTIAKTSLEEQRIENLKKLNQILETHNQIKQLIGQLFDLELPGTLKNLNSNMQKFQDDSKSQLNVINKNQIFLFLAIGLLFVLMVVLKFAI